METMQTTQPRNSGRPPILDTLTATEKGLRTARQAKQKRAESQEGTRKAMIEEIVEMTRGNMGLANRIREIQRNGHRVPDYYDDDLEARQNKIRANKREIEGLGNAQKRLPDLKSQLTDLKRDNPQDESLAQLEENIRAIETTGPIRLRELCKENASLEKVFEQTHGRYQAFAKDRQTAAKDPALFATQQVIAGHKILNDEIGKYATEHITDHDIEWKIRPEARGIIARAEQARIVAKLEKDIRANFDDAKKEFEPMPGELSATKAEIETLLASAKALVESNDFKASTLALHKAMKSMAGFFGKYIGIGQEKNKEIKKIADGTLGNFLIQAKEKLEKAQQLTCDINNRHHRLEHRWAAGGCPHHHDYIGAIKLGIEKYREARNQGIGGESPLERELNAFIEQWEIHSATASAYVEKKREGIVAMDYELANKFKSTYGKPATWRVQSMYIA